MGDQIQGVRGVGGWNFGVGLVFVVPAGLDQVGGDALRWTNRGNNRCLFYVVDPVRDRVQLRVVDL
jgi:hypothetical protein